MRSSASALLVLAACNQIFGNTAVEPAPAGVFDAPIDGPFGCPEIGSTPPFSPYLHQLPITDCSYLSYVGERAVADCLIDGLRVVMIGDGADHLAPAPGVPPSAVPSLPRLSPDGQELYVHDATQIYFYTWSGAMWIDPKPTGILVPGMILYTTIAQAGTVERILVATNMDAIDEYEGRGQTWTRISSVPFSQLGVVNLLGGLGMTSDGRRLVVGTPAGARYADRASLADAFRLGDLIDAPSAADMFLTDNCARIYVSGLGSVFYAQQR